MTPEDLKNTFMLTHVKLKEDFGSLDDLPYAMGKGAIWSLQWLGHMWVLFERTRNDLFLTGSIYALPRQYYGGVAPSDPSGYCSCGSGIKKDECYHKFGVQ